VLVNYLSHRVVEINRDRVAESGAQVLEGNTNGLIEQLAHSR
jgi:hypothetical protein